MRGARCGNKGALAFACWDTNGGVIILRKYLLLCSFCSFSTRPRKSSFGLSMFPFLAFERSEVRVLHCPILSSDGILPLPLSPSVLLRLFFSCRSDRGAVFALSLVCPFMPSPLAGANERIPFLPLRKFDFVVFSRRWAQNADARFQSYSSPQSRFLLLVFGSPSAAALARDASCVACVLHRAAGSRLQPERLDERDMVTLSCPSRSSSIVLFPLSPGLFARRMYAPPGAHQGLSRAHRPPSPSLVTRPTLDLYGARVFFFRLIAVTSVAFSPPLAALPSPCLPSPPNLITALLPFQAAHAALRSDECSLP